MFSMHSGSRRQFRNDSITSDFVHNLSLLANTDVENAPHGDTIVYYLRKILPENFQKLITRMIGRLIRMKALDAYRLFSTFMVAIDGTGQHTFKKRHCPNCLVRKHKSGTLYYHHVLEAKLVTSNGLSLSMATEFIENMGLKASKQDCELKAFYRLQENLKKSFPQLPICLLLDGLYAASPVIEICKKNNWSFFITFKEGSMPATFQEFLSLREISEKNRIQTTEKEETQNHAWVNDMDHNGYKLSVIETIVPNEDRRFVWLTSFHVTKNNVSTLSNQGGRQRWRIENEGFNIQKNGGYELEHPYCLQENGSKNFYLLLQIAHFLNQLMVKGSLLKNFKKQIDTLKNFGKLIREHLRSLRIPPSLMDIDLTISIQIRLNSS